MNFKPMPRRTFLRGVGTVMALPFLEAMTPLTALAQGSRARNLRMAFLFVPNGVNMADWTPKTDGADYAMPYILEPLSSLRSKVLVMTGLTQQNAFALQDGAGDHARSAAAWLTGCHPRKTSGADIKNSISADQVVAKHLEGTTPFSSLELGCERGAQAGDCDSGYSCAYSSGISWRSDTLPLAHETDPRAVFDRFFGSDDPNETAESRARRRFYNKSILDSVLDDANSLRGTLGARDKGKLDEYLTGVREIELRLSRAQKLAPDAGKLAAMKPSSTPSDYGEHIRLMTDMIALAFQADLTRVSTLMFASEGSNRAFPAIGIHDGHHDLSHHNDDPAKLAKLRQINHFQVEQLAYFLQKLNGITEGDGTVLDNTMVLYGGGISDGNAHNHDNLPILMAGGANAGIKSGRHVTYKDGTPLTNLLVSMLDRVGIPGESLGDSTGALQQLV
jgi:hypothetical protein